MTAATLVLAGLALVVAVWLLLPGLRRGAAPVAADRQLAVYRDQLTELERDAARGLVTAAEVEAARAEIERRILRAGRRPEPVATMQEGGRVAAIAAALLVPLVGTLVYGTLGQPNLPDQPLAARDLGPPAEEGKQIEAMVAGLESRLAADADDIEGWLMLGRSKLALGNPPGAVAAFRQVQQRAPSDPRVAANLAEALTVTAGGVVTPEARQLFAAAGEQGLDAGDPRIPFYLGLAEAQAGQGQAALERWRRLLASSPADAEWRGRVEAALRQTAAELGIDPAPILAAAAGLPPTGDAEASASPISPEQMPQVRAMVERLQARLESGGGDAEGWRRLGQARRVLGEAEASRAAFAKAYALAPTSPEVATDYAMSLLGPADPETRLPTVGDEALAVFGQVAERHPEALEPQWYLGVRSLQDGDLEAARRRWSQLLELLGPDHPDRAEIEAFLDALERRPNPPRPTG